MHKYLEGEELTAAEITRGLRLGTLAAPVRPRALTARRCKNKGIQPMLDAVVTTCRRRWTSRR